MKNKDIYVCIYISQQQKYSIITNLNANFKSFISNFHDHFKRYTFAFLPRDTAILTSDENYAPKGEEETRKTHIIRSESKIICKLISCKTLFFSLCWWMRDCDQMMRNKFKIMCWRNCNIFNWMLSYGAFCAGHCVFVTLLCVFSHYVIYTRALINLNVLLTRNLASLRLQQVNDPRSILFSFAIALF